MSIRNSIPRHLVTAYEKARTGKSRRYAIYAFCHECMGYQREEVEACTDTGCPLFQYRSPRSCREVARKRSNSDDQG